MVSSGSYRRQWIGFSAMSVGLFMAVLDIQIVAAALPRIAQSLHTPLDELSWVQTAYLITEIIAIVASGRLARALSTRWLYVLATCGFALTSLGCAFSHDFVSLIVWRTLQGFMAGIITPTVFAAGYKMFPKALHRRAILVAGSVVMLAPSVGPFLGGSIAAKLSWNWLFIVNVPIAIAVAIAVGVLVRVDRAEPQSWKTFDVAAFAALAVSMACLEIALKIGPEDRWIAVRDYGLAAATIGGAAYFVRRCVSRSEPFVDFGPMRQLGFSIACALNFVIGLGLYSSLYIMPLFLGFVRYHTPLEIGIIMTIAGAAQLVAAPFAALVDRRVSPRIVAAIGFALFAAGSFANAFQTPRTDFSELVLPQALRGAALLFCILPITNVALDELPEAALSNASGLLNFMRNIGGAVGIGLVDTVINLRPPAIATHLVERAVRGDAGTDRFIGIPQQLLANVDFSHADPSDKAFLTPLITRAAETVASNEAWLLCGGLVAASLLLVPFLRRPPTARVSSPTPRASVRMPRLPSGSATR